MTGKMHMNYAAVPTNCHLWKQETPSLEFETIKEYPEGSFVTFADECLRRLKKCAECGQLYFYQMAELRDMAGGDDPVYCTYVPVATEEDADKLALLSDIMISSHLPQIKNDWPKGAAQTTRWVREKTKK